MRHADGCEFLAKAVQLFAATLFQPYQITMVYDNSDGGGIFFYI